MSTQPTTNMIKLTITNQYHDSYEINLKKGNLELNLSLYENDNFSLDRYERVKSKFETKTFFLDFLKPFKSKMKIPITTKLLIIVKHLELLKKQSK